MIRYEIFGEQDETDIEPGDVLTLEASIGRQLSSGWDLGLTAYHQRQVTTEKGSAPGTDTTKYRYSGIGPEINWRPASVPGFQVGLRAYFEFGARNSSEGVFTVLSLAYLWGK